MHERRVPGDLDSKEEQHLARHGMGDVFAVARPVARAAWSRCSASADGQLPVTSLGRFLISELGIGGLMVGRWLLARRLRLGAPTPEPVGLRFKKAIEQRLLLPKRMRHRRLFAASHDEFLVAEDG